jgi:hypothetical protein
MGLFIFDLKKISMNESIFSPRPLVNVVISKSYHNIIIESKNSHSWD